MAKLERGSDGGNRFGLTEPLGAYLNCIVKAHNAEHLLRSVYILYAMMPYQMTMQCRFSRQFPNCLDRKRMGGVLISQIHTLFIKSNVVIVDVEIIEGHIWV